MEEDHEGQNKIGRRGWTMLKEAYVSGEQTKNSKQLF